MTSTPDPVDERLVGAHDLALAALREITGADTIGEPVGWSDEGDGVVSLRFANRLAGYPGWFWTVSVARVDDEEPTVLEVELLPGDDALLAPEWVPWAVRLAEYQAAQAALAETAEGDAGVESGDEDADGGEDDDLADDTDDEDDDLDDADEDLDDDEDLDEDAEDDDLDEDAGLLTGPRLHAGDVDGVDIDELDDSADLDDSAEPELEPEPEPSAEPEPEPDAD